MVAIAIFSTDPVLRRSLAQLLREDLTYTARDQIATETRYTDLAGTQLAGTSSYVYDADERLTSLVQTYANGSVLASYVYNYDQASRLTSEVDNGGATIVYGYDNANQLLSAGPATYGCSRASSALR